MSTLRYALIVLVILFAPYAGAEPIDINTADAAALIELDGIGPRKAEAIITYRNEHGPFQSVEDLAKVSGIGERMIDNLRDQVSVSATTASVEKP